jgi:Uma2 family endonuclease
MTVEPARHRFTVHDYYRMAEAGILHEDERVELLDGEIIEMTPIGSRHSSIVERLNWLFSQRLDLTQTLVRVQDPIRLSPNTEPQPDIAIVAFREDFYRLRHPGPDEVLLLIEVADSSLLYDHEIKVPLYARAGVPEVWVINANASLLDVFRQPSSSGYLEHRQLDTFANNLIVPDSLPQIILRVREIVPEEQDNSGSKPPSLP